MFGSADREKGGNGAITPDFRLGETVCTRRCYDEKERLERNWGALESWKKKEMNESQMSARSMYFDFGMED